MSKIRRTDMGGSIVLFVFIGVILAISLISGIYILKLRGEQARRDQAIAIVEKQFADSQAEETKKIVTTSSEEATSNEAVSTVDSSTASQNLPVTGSGMMVSQIIGAGLLTVFIVSYIKSRFVIVRYL
ncbi:MAG: hypothetical protein WCQ49_00030 [Candidatus Saccharibacteria bacterium]